MQPKCNAHNRYYVNKLDVSRVTLASLSSVAQRRSAGRLLALGVADPTPPTPAGRHTPESWGDVSDGGYWSESQNPQVHFHKIVE